VVGAASSSGLGARPGQRHLVVLVVVTGGGVVGAIVVEGVGGVKVAVTASVGELPLVTMIHCGRAPRGAGFHRCATMSGGSEVEAFFVQLCVR
jgi:hypothetical protein